MNQKPVRLQLSRAKGFSLQALSRATNGLPAVNVARPSKWGNICSCRWPHACVHSPEFDNGPHWHGDPPACCVDLFRHCMERVAAGEPTTTGSMIVALEAMNGYPRINRMLQCLPEIRGKNLACWCAFNKPCHADVLLELANRQEG